MDFKYNDKTGYWVTSASVRGRTVEVAIDKCYPEEQLAQLTDDVVRRVDNHWDHIQSNIADSLLDTHNESWADADEGFPELSRDDFLARIILDQVQLMEEDAITLYFGDSDIFGGHLVDLFWTTEKMYPATLVG